MQRLTEPWLRVLDAVLVLVCLAVAWQGLHAGAGTPGPDGLALAAMLPGILLLPWRRRWPAVVLLTGTLCNLAYWIVFGAPESGGMWLSVVFAMYAEGRWDGDRRRSVLLVLMAVPFMVVHEVRDPTITDLRALLGALPYDAMTVMAWLLGSLIRSRTEQRRTLSEKIAGEERSRIARELHDIVAHGIGVMVVQAEGAAEVVDHDPERARAAMERVAQTGRESLVELRRALGMLRDAGRVTHEPLPGLARIDQLIDRARAAGLDVTSETVGNPARLSPGADLALYRVVQEALTNTLRHAGASRALVRVCHGLEKIDVEVLDDGQAHPGQAITSGGGLLGIDERIRMLGGQAELGARPEGGFRVAVSIPRAPAVLPEPTR